MNPKREVRFVNGEMRAEEKDGKHFISGYAAVFNSLSEDLGGFRELVLPGAFKRSLSENADVRMLINHDASMIVGRTAAGTLTLAEDDKGLKFRCEMPDTSYSRDLMESVKRGDISQCSFGFIKRADEWKPGEKGAGVRIRELQDVDLFDASAVTYPAYPDTSVQARSLWPDGMPVEVREHLPAEPALFADAKSVRNALVRFNRKEDRNAEEKKAEWEKILAAAKKFGINVSEENSAKLYESRTAKASRAILQSFDPDGDGDDDTDLMDALYDADNGCFNVHAAASAACDLIYQGEPDYRDPALHAFIGMANALIADLQDAITEVQKELAEPPTEDDGGRALRVRAVLASL